MLTIDGLASGFDTTSIIEGLTEIQQRQVNLLQTRRNTEVDRQTAFKGVEAGVISLRSVASRVGRTRGNVFSSRTVTSSDDTVLAATADSNAAVGSYSIKVNQLAQAHQVGSQGLSGPNAEITQGTVSLRVGSGESVDITIDETNNTLNGLAEAINNSDAGVQATIINDGSSGSSPYRLLLTSGKTGESNAITVTNNLADSLGAAVKPDFSGPAIQDAQDAAITLGSGAGAITVQSATNTFEDVVAGVTMQLQSADPDKTITLRVERDTEAAVDAVSDFVGAFNNVMQYIDNQTAYSPDTESAGALLGNRATIAIQDDLRRAVTDTVSGLNPQANRLSQIGISLTNNGQLVLNESRLRNILDGQVSEISDDDLRKLFSFSGDSSNAGIEFLGGSTRTEDGVDIEVDITQAAKQAVATATNALAASTVIDETNNSLTLDIDGATGTVTLASGTYTATELADLIQDSINQSDDFSARSVQVGVEGGLLQITSESYGLASELGSFSGSSLTALGFDGSESGQGQDVVGRFLVDGEIEEAIGRGRFLTGDSENEFTADLQLTVSLAESQVIEGVDSQLTLTRGIGARLDKILGGLLDPSTGRIKTANDEFDTRIGDIDDSITKQNELFESRRVSLQQEFVALESAISQLQSQSNFVAAQLG